VHKIKTRLSYLVLPVILVLLYICSSTVFADQASEKEIFDKGYSLSKLGMYEDALKQFDLLIQMNPKGVSGYYGKGNVYMDQKKYEEALAMFQKSVEVDPKFIYGHNNIGEP